MRGSRCTTTPPDDLGNGFYTGALEYEAHLTSGYVSEAHLAPDWIDEVSTLLVAEKNWLTERGPTWTNDDNDRPRSTVRKASGNPRKISGRPRRASASCFNFSFRLDT